MYHRANQRLLGEHTQGQIKLQTIYKAFFNTEFLLFLFSFLSCLRYQLDYSNDAIQTNTQMTYILCFIQNSQDWSHHERTQGRSHVAPWGGRGPCKIEKMSTSIYTNFNWALPMMYIWPPSHFCSILEFTPRLQFQLQAILSSNKTKHGLQPTYI